MLVLLLHSADYPVAVIHATLLPVHFGEELTPIRSAGTRKASHLPEQAA